MEHVQLKDEALVKIEHNPLFFTNLEEKSKINASMLELKDNEKLSSNASPKVFVSLKSRKNTQKHHSPEIVERLIEKMNIKDSKIVNMRMKQIADELEKNKQVPKINKNSRRIAEGKLPMHKSNAKKFYDSRGIDPESLPNTNLIRDIEFTVDVFKDSIKLRENFSEIKSDLKQPAKKLTWTEKAKLIKETKAKKIEDAQRIKEINEMVGCTFKPKTCPKNQTNETGSIIIKRSQSSK